MTKRIAAVTIVIILAVLHGQSLNAAPAQPVNPRNFLSDSTTCLLERRATALEIIAACTRLIDSARPDDNVFMLSDAYNERGRAHAGLHHQNEAMENFATAILLDPDNADAHFNRGSIYLDRKNYALAIKDFDAAVDGNPMDALALFDRGMAKFRMGNKNGAETDFKAAIALDPRFEEARARLAPAP